MDVERELDRDSLRTRRSVLTGLLGGAAAALAATLGHGRPVGATHDSYVELGHSNATDGVTQFDTSGSDSSALYGLTSSGTALVARTDSGTGVDVVTDSGPAVLATSTSGNGVHGLSTSGIGTIGASNSNQGVHATSNEEIALWAQSGAVARPAVFAWAYLGNTAVFGVSGLSAPPGAPDGPAKTGVFGYAAQDAAAVGVRGTSPLGRGGIFKGGAAAIRLTPSTSTSHPASGQKGDLYVDSNARLWFCKGGMTWVRLA